MDSTRVESTGFESSIVKSWEGWDGDMNYVTFYNPELTEVGQKLFNMPSGVLEGFTVGFYLDKDCRVQLYDVDGITLLKEFPIHFTPKV